MYRSILTVFVYLSAVLGAPQDAVNSGITYVKMNPTITNEIPPEHKSPYRESRIENLPLTIGTGNANASDVNPYESNPSEINLYDNNQSETNPYRSNQSETRHVRSEEYTTSNYQSAETETTEAVTERNESLEELINQTEQYETQTKSSPPPRFYSKLSYFQKNHGSDSVSTNLIKSSGKRKFRSKCRCEKIWNCPKLQITVPRCPNEYFLCCF